MANTFTVKPFPINFDDKRHAYTTKEGELYTGVTNIVGLMRKGFMAPWAALEAVKHLGYRGKGDYPELTEELLEEAKNSWRRISDEAKVAGSLAHDWVERNIAGETQDLPENKEACNAVNAFIEWSKKVNPQWHASELIVGSQLHRFAGTLDAIATINGKLTLVDFKTSKAIYPENFIQLSAYQIALEEYQQITPQKRMVVRLPKDGKPVEVKVDWIPHDLCKSTFLHLREASKFESYIKNHKK